MAKSDLTSMNGKWLANSSNGALWLHIEFAEWRALSWTHHMKMVVDVFCFSISSSLEYVRYIQKCLCAAATFIIVLVQRIQVCFLLSFPATLELLRIGEITRVVMDIYSTIYIHIKWLYIHIFCLIFQWRLLPFHSRSHTANARALIWIQHQ